MRGLLAGLPARAMLHLVINCEGCEFELLEVLFLSHASQARVFCHTLDKAERFVPPASLRACVHVSLNVL